MDIAKASQAPQGEVCFVFGTRPELIKMFPVIQEFKKRGEEVTVLFTSQHQSLFSDNNDLFKVELNGTLELPDEFYGATVPQKLASLIAHLESNPLYMGSRKIVVQGDTLSTLSGALVGFLNSKKVVHIEAGLRVQDLMVPFPEEGARRLISQITSLHCCHSEWARSNLLQLGVDKKIVHNTGNPIIDAVTWVADQISDTGRRCDKDIPQVLITMHRRENHGQPMENVLAAISEMRGYRFLWVTHPNPKVVSTVEKFQSSVNAPHIEFLPPQNYASFIALLQTCDHCLSDSGGIQEEGVALGKRIGILRVATERPEAVDAGIHKLIDPNEHGLHSKIEAFLTEKFNFDERSRNLFGDGKAGFRIANLIQEL